jgi:glucose/arabinose dehydrogenase
MAAPQGGSPPPCRPDGELVTVPELVEASGIAVSRRVPGRLWMHNDGSGEPVLFALDTRGSVTGKVSLSGATVEDWEAVAVGPCPAGSCVYVADIGDNDARRTRITICRLPEPSAGDESVAVKDVFHATYPDGAHDAEALLITADGRMFVVTKGDAGPVALYRFPQELRPGATHQLERVGQPRGGDKPAARITDAPSPQMASGWRCAARRTSRFIGRRS